LKSLADYIIAVDGVMPLDMCEGLIEAYDKCEDIVIRSNDTYYFSEVNMLDNPAFEEFRDPMVQLMTIMHREYQKRTGNLMPDTEAYEAPRIKKYEPNEGIFDWHIDAADHASGRRLLVMFWYLNDVDEGGHTVFNIGQEISVAPRAGRVVCFPPNFMYPHKGATPISGPKYVVSSYVHLP
jgi:prolyl 4-hydroxylase